MRTSSVPQMYSKGLPFALPTMSNRTCSRDGGVCVGLPRRGNTLWGFFKISSVFFLSLLVKISPVASSLLGGASTCSFVVTVTDDRVTLESDSLNRYVLPKSIVT